MADEYQVIDDPNDPRLSGTPLNDEFDPNAYGAQAPAPVANTFDPAAYASGEKEKPPEQPQALPTIAPKIQTFYYPATPEDTQAAGLSYRMEGGIHGAGKFSDLDLRNHTLEQYKAGKSPFVAVAMAGVPTGAEFMTPVNGELVRAQNVDTGGGLKEGQQDIATSNPDLARGGGSGGGFNPKAYADGKPSVPDIHAFLEPAPADTPEGETKDEPSPAEIAGGAISKAASKYGAALANRPKLDLTPPQFQPPAIPQVPQPQQQVIPGQGMIGAAIPTALPTPQRDYGQPNPQLEGGRQAVVGMVPRSFEQLKQMATLPRAEPLDVEALNRLGATWRGEHGQVAQARELTNLALQAAPLAHLPPVTEAAGAVGRSLVGSNIMPHMQEVGAIGATGGGKRTYQTPSGEVTIQGGEVPVPESFQPRFSSDLGSGGVEMRLDGFKPSASDYPEGRGKLAEDGVAGKLYLEHPKYFESENKPPPDFMVVDSAVIAKSLQHKGYGTRLYNEALALAKSQGYKGISSHSADRNFASDSFWKKNAQGSKGGYDTITNEIPETGTNASGQNTVRTVSGGQSVANPPHPPAPPVAPPPPSGGVPPQPPKSVPIAMRLRAIRDRIASGKDSVFTVADYQARQKANGVRQDFGAQTTRSPSLKENVQANKDMEAATFIAEAQGNKIALAHDLEMVRNSKDAKLAKKYEPILKYAMDNFTRISDQLAKSRYTKLMSDQLAEDTAAGITYPEREGYVTHVLKNEPANAFVSFFTGKMGSGGLSRYFTKSREFGTLAEAINAGVDPASVNLADLAQHRIASSRRLILNKALFNELKNIQGPDGNPVLKGVFRHPDPPHGTITPKGYELMNLNGVEVAVHPAYSGLFKSLYGDSALRRTALGRGTMRTAGVLKSYTLAADTYHGFRGIKKGLFYGGKGSRLGFKRGTTVYELSDEGLDTAVKNNEITKGQADWAKSARPAIEEMMKNGLNVSKYADNLVGQMHVNFPGTGRLNDLIFNRVFRGAMIQASHSNYLRNLSRFPELTKQEVARRTAKEMNEVFGNMMSQGWIKDKTLQDTSQLILLSPQWVQSQIMAEFRGYGQQGKMISDAFQGKFRMGTVAQGQATAVLAYLVGNQIINYATTGHSTFENDGWTNKMSAFLPVGDRGVYLNPFALSAEYADRFLTIMDRQGEDSNVFSVLSEMGKSKLTGAANAVVTMATQRDWRSRRLDTAGDVLLEMGKDVVPVPIGVKNVGGSMFSSDPNSTLGFGFDPQYDEITQSVLQAMGERGNLGPGTSQYPSAPLRVPTQRAVRQGRQKRGVY